MQFLCLMSRFVFRESVEPWTKHIVLARCHGVDMHFRGSQTKGICLLRTWTARQQKTSIFFSKRIYRKEDRRTDLNVREFCPSTVNHCFEFCEYSTVRTSVNCAENHKSKKQIITRRFRPFLGVDDCLHCAGLMLTIVRIYFPMPFRSESSWKSHRVKNTVVLLAIVVGDECWVEHHIPLTSRYA